MNFCRGQGSGRDGPFAAKKGKILKSVSALKKVHREAAARRPVRSEPEKPRFFREAAGRMV